MQNMHCRETGKELLIHIKLQDFAYGHLVKLIQNINYDFVIYLIIAYTTNGRTLSVMVIQHRHKLPWPLRKLEKASISTS